MILGLCLITVTCIGWAIASTATRHADRSSRQRDVNRRFRQLRHHPDRVNLLDVENLLIADAIPETTVKRVMRQASSRRIGARTMWRWADTHGSDKVALVICADVAEDTLLDHLDAGTTPDWESLGASANRSSVVTSASTSARTSTDIVASLDIVPSMADLITADDFAAWETESVDAWETQDGDEDLPKAA